MSTPFQQLVKAKHLSIPEAQRFKKWANAYGIDVHEVGAWMLDMLYDQWKPGVAAVPDTITVAAKIGESGR